MTHSITLPELHLLDIGDPQGGVAQGGNQAWYPDEWRRMSGCGPVAASNMVWYLSRARPGLAGLCDPGAGGRADFLGLMEEMFTYITPGKGGVHSAELFIPGLLRYCADRGHTLGADSLVVPRRPCRGPDAGAVRDFLSGALGAGWPVAFLNLSNGKLPQPDSWHWVTLLAVEPGTLAVRVSDEGRMYEADLKLWLETTLLGGALVALRQG